VSNTGDIEQPRGEDRAAATGQLEEGEILTREIDGVGTLRFEDLPAGGWLTQKGQPSKLPRRRYTLNEEELLAVSGITGTLEKAALVPWAEAKGIEGTVRAYRAGLIGEDTDGPRAVQIVRAESLGADAQRDEAADRGKAIHKAFELLATTGEAPKLGDYPTEWHPWIKGAVRAWMALNPEPEEVEQIVCNPQRRYAGRPDLICRIGGRRTLVDYKTGKGRVYDQAHYQTRLYELALEPSLIEPIEDIIIIGIGDDGEWEPVHCEATELDALGLLSVHLSRKRINAGMASQRAQARKALKAAA
jgi:hypothetical protein